VSDTSELAIARIRTCGKQLAPKENLERGNVVVVQLMAKAQQSTVAANHILQFWHWCLTSKAPLSVALIELPVGSSAAIPKPPGSAFQ